MNAMNRPNVVYYAKMVYSTAEGKKTPKYTIVSQYGYYPPMEQLRGRDGNISMNLMNKLKDSANVPSMRLQAKNSLNFTGLKELFRDGELSGYAYGYPNDEATYGKENKPNPFYEYKEDGFLFIMEADKDNTDNLLPVAIELIVLRNAKPVISGWFDGLVSGHFDADLCVLREGAEKS